MNKKIIINDLLKYKFISNIEFSPNKTKLAFNIHKCDEKNNSYKSYIYIYKLENKEIFKLTSLGTEGRYLWLDDNNIIFSSERNVDNEKKKNDGEKYTTFYKININGGEASKFAVIPAIVKNIRVIDENNFAVIAEYDSNVQNLYELEGEARINAIEKIKNERDYHVLDEVPFWTNGGTFTNGKRNRLYIYNVHNKYLKEISGEKEFVKTVVVKDNKLLYTVNNFENIRSEYTNVYLYDLSEDKSISVIPKETYAVRVADFMCNKILIIGNDMKGIGMKQHNEMFFAENGNLVKFAENPYSFANTVNSDCRYSAGAFSDGMWYRINNNKLYMVITEENYSSIWEYSEDGSSRIITGNQGSVDYFDISNNEIYFIGLKGIKLQEIYSSDLNGIEKQITDFNEDILRDKYVSCPERFEYSYNGRNYTGFVMKPIDYNPDETYPAILEIHGGPKTVYGDVFYHEMQLMASKGYFVFYCNPFGSDGRGDEFANLRYKWGGPDFEDIMYFLDMVIEKYLEIDKERIGVTGGSYGGFMTNWIIGHTNKFRCAVSQRSISNWVSQFGISDIGYFMTKDEIEPDFYENIQTTWDRSPLRYASKVKTPTLFIHSACDYRCPLSEAMQMFSAIRLAGVETRMCIFEGENHELSRSGKPLHRIRRLEEMLDWMDKYLMR